MSDTTFIFKVDDGKYEAFTISSLKVTKSHSSCSGDVCDCPSFRVTGGCVLTKFLEEPIHHKVGAVESSPPTTQKIEMESRMFSEGPPMGLVGVKTELGDATILEPMLPNYGLSDLLVGMKTGRLPASFGDGHISPHRLYAQCKASQDNDVIIVDDLVKNVDYEVTSEVDPSLLESAEEDAADVETAFEFTRGCTSDKWQSVQRPNPKHFFVDDDTWKNLVYSITNGKNVLLTGPSGCGKSELVWMAAQKLGLEESFQAFNMGAMSEPRTSLIGATHFDDTRGTWFNQSRFVRTVTKDSSVILLDEITRADRGAFNILLPLMDRQGYLALDEAEDATTIHKAEGVSFVATANIGSEYTGTDEMDQALKNRFSSIIDVEFPPTEYEVDILRARTGCKFSQASKLCELAVRQREMCVRDGEFMTQISTRMLIEAAEKIACGFSFQVACKFAVENHFSSEGGSDDSERVRIRQIIQKNGV
jgi:energy-coupling factor transporter ATP-binding protein EcfA2